MVNTYSRFIKGCCMIAALLMVIPLAGQNGKDSPIFKTRRQTNVTRSLTKAQITTSDTIPLQNLGAIYAFSIDATITQPREASFVRIVLEDTEGHDYLVAESDRFRNDTSIVQLTGYCEETAKLHGVTPLCLKCYLAGDATLLLTSYHVSDQEPTRGQAANEETDAAIKEAQVQSIVERINEYNARHGKLWRAGLNNWALAEYDSDIKGEGDAYTANFKYYTDGIYEMGERPAQRSTYNSPYVDSFDWRYRHGQNWIGDSIRNQGSSEFCTVFAVVGSVEALTTIFYNDTTIRLDLSEQDVISYSTGNGVWFHKFITSELAQIRDNGVLDEQSVPFTGLGGTITDPPRPIGNECVSIEWYYMVNKDNMTFNQYTDTIKYHLIKYGPLIWGYNYGESEMVYGKPVMNHFMTLVGYGVVTANDYYTIVNSHSNPPAHYVESGASVIGKTYWIYKDSYGNYSKEHFGHNGFRYVIFNDENKMHLDFAYIQTPIYRRGHPHSEIKVEDLDGDGYFNWGIGERPDSLLPDWAELEPDGDDANPFIGSLDDYGIGCSLGYGWNADDIYEVSSNQIDTLSTFHRGGFEIGNDVVYTIKATEVFHPQAVLHMYSGSTLIVDGGKLVDPPFLFESGCSVILNNGGEIIYTKHMPTFTSPLGLKLTINEGRIRYVRDYW